MSLINYKDWKYNSFGFEPETEIRYQTYDNIKHTLMDTTEWVFAIYGIRDGIEQYFYFKRI